MADKKFKPKYIAKVPINKPKNKYRYFYTRKDYQAYLDGKKKSSDDKKSLKDKMQKTADTLKKAAKSTGKKIIDSIDKTKQTISSISNKTINKGKERVSDILTGPLGNTPIGQRAIAEKERQRRQQQRRLYEEARQQERNKFEIRQKRAAEEVSNVLKKLQSRTDKDKERLSKSNVEKTKALQALYKKNDLTYIDTLGDIPKKHYRYTRDEDRKLVNPKYDGSTYAYSNNCANCTAAYDMRRRGYDVEAAPKKGYTKYYGVSKEYEEFKSGYGSQSYLFRSLYKDAPEFTSYKEMYEKYEKDHPIKSKFTLSDSHTLAKEVIENELLSHGEGARGNFVIRWAYGGGHSIAWEVSNGKVEFIDCQSNTLFDIENSLFWANRENEFYEIRYLRTDNLEPSLNIGSAIKYRSDRSK